MNYTKKQLFNLKAFERTGSIIAKTTYGSINTRSIEFKNFVSTYEEVYNEKVNASCVSCCFAAIKKAYNDYWNHLQGDEVSIEELREQYKDQKGKAVSKRFWNDKDWILSKID